ncbi:MAG: type I-E CRISPR-associated endoribonuclease Cas2e, partial [Clostridia bacterium]
MIVISLTDCPPKIRGDLSKWLCELSTGVYVGQVNARVRDALWSRICSNLKSGKATMVFSANNEQRMDFRVYHSVWEPIDFDGLKLMLRPSPARLEKRSNSILKDGYSNAAMYKKAKNIQAAKQKEKPNHSYVAVDVETTGLSSATDEIIELAAIHVVNGEVAQRYSSLIAPKCKIPPEIIQLTGITQEMLEKEGKPLIEALPAFLNFVGSAEVVAHNATFDYAFLRCACQVCNLPLFSNHCIDTLPLAKRKVEDVTSYKLAALAEHFGFNTEHAHRAFKDC